MPPVLSPTLLLYRFANTCQMPRSQPITHVVEWAWTLAEERRDYSVDWGVGTTEATASCLSIWRSHFKRIQNAHLLASCPSPCEAPSSTCCVYPAEETLLASVTPEVRKQHRKTMLDWGTHSSAERNNYSWASGP